MKVRLLLASAAPWFGRSDLGTQYEPTPQYLPEAGAAPGVTRLPADDCLVGGRPVVPE